MKPIWVSDARWWHWWRQLGQEVLTAITAMISYSEKNIIINTAQIMGSDKNIILSTAQIYVYWKTSLHSLPHIPRYSKKTVCLPQHTYEYFEKNQYTHYHAHTQVGGGPRVVVSTAAFHARVRGSVPGLGGLKETKNVSSPSTCESQYCGEPPWPRGSVLDLGPSGLEFRILCLNHPTILRRFSWPSLAYMCTKVT